MKKILLSCCIVILYSFNGFSQTNLLDTSTWTVGSGSVTGFNQFGSTNVNERLLGNNPHAEEEVLWRGTPEEGTIHSGGWTATKVTIDHTRDYRITVWLKKTNHRNGQGQLGIFCRDELDRFTAIDVVTAENQPYAVTFSNVLPELDKWFLVVGYVYNSLHLGTTVEGGVYDPVTGDKVMDARATYRFHPEAKTLEHFSYLYDTNIANSQFFWDPRIEEINNNIPTIADLLAGRDAPMPTELVFDYDTSGNNKLRRKPQAQARTAANEAVNNQRSAPVYPPGYFDTPVSGDERYDQLAASIIIHPNPTAGELFVSWEEQFQDMVIDVVGSDMSGRSVPVNHISGTLEVEIDLSLYPSGMYLIRFLLSDGREIEKKVIKE